MVQTRKKKYRLFPFKMPTAITILFFIIATIILISWIPGTTGQWTDDDKKNHPGGPLGILDLFLAPIQGFLGSAEIIVFVLVIGGYIGIVMKSGALDAGIGRLVKRLKGKEIWIIPSLMTILSIGGTVEGMCEETIPYYLIVIPAMLAAGFDVITAVLIILLGAGVGVMFSTLNPFAIATANTASGIQNIGEGLIWRLICWFLATLGTIAFVMWYAIRVKKNPEKSLTFHLQSEQHAEFFNTEEIPEFTKKRKIILTLFGLTFLIMILCIIPWGKLFHTNIFIDFQQILINHFPYLTSQINGFGEWHTLHLAFLFFFASIIIAIIDWHGEEHYVRTFINGSSELLGVALIIAVAGGIGWAIQTSGMQTIFVDSLKSKIHGLSKILIVIIGFFLFLIIAFLIPSTSGFAKAVFPVISSVVQPLGLGSGMITTFVMASGWINLFAPSAGVMMAGLAIAKVPLTTFYRVTWPYMIGIFAFALIMLSIGTLLPSSIF